MIVSEKLYLVASSRRKYATNRTAHIAWSACTYHETGEYNYSFLRITNFRTDTRLRAIKTSAPAAFH